MRSPNSFHKTPALLLDPATFPLQRLQLYSFSISVKRLPGGVVSNWLHDNLKAGDELAVHGPVGNFNIIDHAADKVLMPRAPVLAAEPGLAVRPTLQ